MDDEALLLELATQPDTGDADIAEAIESIRTAIEGLKIPEFPKFDSASIVKAIKSLGSASDEIRLLREDISTLTAAIRAVEFPATDMAPLAEALKEIAKSKQAQAKALSAPKEIVFDNQGNPIGIRPFRMN